MQVRMSLIPDTNIEDFLFKKLQTLPIFTKVTNLNTLIASEINQLKRGQIPIFYSDIFSTKILDIHHKTVTHLIGTC